MSIFIDINSFELRDLEMLNDYIFNNDSLQRIGRKYDLAYPFYNIKKIAIKIGIVEKQFNKNQIQNKEELYKKLSEALEEKRNFQNTIDDILLT